MLPTAQAGAISYSLQFIANSKTAWDRSCSWPVQFSVLISPGVLAFCTAVRFVIAPCATQATGSTKQQQQQQQQHQAAASPSSSSNQSSLLSSVVMISIALPSSGGSRHSFLS